MAIVERTCLECRQLKMCDHFLAVCEDCVRKVWAPALGFEELGQKFEADAEALREAEAKARRVLEGK